MTTFLTVNLIGARSESDVAAGLTGDSRAPLEFSRVSEETPAGPAGRWVVDDVPRLHRHADACCRRRHSPNIAFPLQFVGTPPLRSCNTSWRALYGMGPFFQRELEAEDAIGRAAAQRRLKQSGRTRWDSWDELGVLRPVAFARCPCAGATAPRLATEPIVLGTSNPDYHLGIRTRTTHGVCRRSARCSPHGNCSSCRTRSTAKPSKSLRRR